MKRCPLVLVALLAALSVLVTPPAPADDFPRTRRAIEAALRDGKVASITVAASKNGEIVWEEGFGWANRAARIRATPQTMYSLASISKPITATALMVLVERGEIDLDAPVNDYLGAVKLRARRGDARDATVRRVANHTSGLPLHYQFFYEDEPRSVPSRDVTIARYGNLFTEPGKRLQYSNLGFGVLDYVIARVSGKSYADFLHDEVFVPLGLSRCAVGVPAELAEHQALRYGEDNRPIPFYDFDHPGASAVYCSAHDLLRFGMFHLRDSAQPGLPEQNAILNAASLDEMVRPTSRANGRGYGVGWGISETEKGVTTVSHSGGMGGVATSLTLVPEEDAAVVVLINSRGPLRRVTDELLAELLPTRFDPPPTEEERQEEPAATAFRPTGELVGLWRGSLATYAGEMAVELRVQEKGRVDIRLGEHLWAVVSDPALEDGRLRGRFVGDLGTEDTTRRDASLALDLTVIGQVLDGAVIAFTEGDRNKIGNALSHWIELERVDAAGVD